VSIPAGLGDPLVLAALPEFPPPVASGPSALELWPADVHVIGKDILKFHAVYWPIMLKAMELPLPKRLLVHGWWQKDGAKISKSTGNIVEPGAVIREWGLDAFRYYVLRELDIGPDGNWTDAGFAARYQAELANGLGNLVNRSLSMLRRYRNGVVPKRSDALAPEVEKSVSRIAEELRTFQLQSALESIWRIVNRANQYVDQTAPFKLAKEPSQSARLDEVLYNLVETCRVLAVLLWPFLPSSAGRIFAQLGLKDAPDSFASAKWGELAAGHNIGEPIPLFPRRDLAVKPE
jgi:methionyl-tRNA synthetase